MKKYFSLISKVLLLCAFCVVIYSCKDECNCPNDNTPDGYVNTTDIPKYIQDSLKNHNFPIYSGTTPPNVEGVYYVDPAEAVYSSDGYFDPGEYASSVYILLSNQSGSNVTFEMKDDVTAGQGEAAVIAGTGNNFTLYVIANTTNGSATAKVATLITGTKTAGGIKDIRYAGTMIEKNDPNGIFMDEGTFRIFKDSDELAENASLSQTMAAITNNIFKTMFQTKEIQSNKIK